MDIVSLVRLPVSHIVRLRFVGHKMSGFLEFQQPWGPVGRGVLLCIAVRRG